MADLKRLFCLVDGESTSNAFPVDIESTKTVGHLKKAIKDEKPKAFGDIDADELTLWKVSVSDTDDDDDVPVLLDSLADSAKKKLRATSEISGAFGTSPLPKRTIHVLVERPPPVHTSVPARVSTPVYGYLSDESRPGTPPNGDLRVDIKKIRDEFFAAGSRHAMFLDSYVQGLQSLPTTTTGVRGLPKVSRRGVVGTLDSGPNLLFLDLPDPPSSVGAPVPERFRSNVLLDVLEGMQAQELPVFGVSGCGKTRSVIEILCLQWGFYFNAAKSDFGSGDLFYLADTIESERSQDSTLSNTTLAKSMTLLLFLSRLMILRYCLEVPGCRQTFSSARWALLQVCPNMFKDVFLPLCMGLFDLMKGRTIPVLVLVSIVRKELESVRKMLAAHDYPNFSVESKLRLVIDEAQILSDNNPTSFASKSNDNDVRPLLSPVLHAFRLSGIRDELTIIYCGTGLSMKTLDWAMSSGDGVKEYGSSTFPMFEFPGWTSPDSIRSYIDRVKEQLPDDESKKMVDTLIPPAAVEMLHERLTGRFRPIVVAISAILETGKWETVINNTETAITSWMDRDRRGNMCAELNRLENKIANHPEIFRSYSSIKETLGVLLFRHCLLDESSTVLDDGVHLVEAAFGRIKLFSGNRRTVIDEPLALKATYNYFQEKDPSLISAAERSMLHSGNASVHGHMWETMMPPVFVETFKTRPLSSWPLLNKNSLPEQLVGDVTIIGYDEQQPKLVISHKNITTQQFMKAHVENNSKQGDQDVPPFYFPAPHVSGPDIIFFIKIKGNMYPCFVQLKLRQVVGPSDLEKAQKTVSSQAVQRKMEVEHKKQQQNSTCAQSDQQQSPQLKDYCPTGIYISMVITYPAEIVDFQVVRPDPGPELEGLQRVSIGIDDNNFPKIFPRRHVEFLDRLKRPKRRSEDQQPESSKRLKAIDP